MSKRYFLNKDGEVVKLHFRDIGTSWVEMSTNYACVVTKDEMDFLDKYGLNATIFNVANLRSHGCIYLTPHYVNVVLKHGAIDKTKVDDNCKNAKFGYCRQCSDGEHMHCQRGGHIAKDCKCASKKDYTIISGVDKYGIKGRKAK